MAVFLAEGNRGNQEWRRALERTARKLGVELHPVEVHGPHVSAPLAKPLRSHGPWVKQGRTTGAGDGEQRPPVPRSRFLQHLSPSVGSQQFLKLGCKKVESNA